MVKFVLGVSALALLGGVAAAADASQPTASNANDKDKVVCRTVDETGSRLSKTRACHTLAEWAELRRQTKEDIDHIQTIRPAHLSN